MSISPRGKGRRAAAKKPAATSSPLARPAADPFSRAGDDRRAASHGGHLGHRGRGPAREITNTNSTFLAERLFDAGLDVCEQRVVADEAADMRRALEELAHRAAVVVVTGGLGPTEDDRTVDVAAELLGSRRSHTVLRWRR